MLFVTSMDRCSNGHSNKNANKLTWASAFGTWDHIITGTPWMKKRLFNATSEEEWQIRHQPIPVAGISSDLEVAMEKCYNEEVTNTSAKKSKAPKEKPSGWFRFGEGGEFHRVTEIFIRCLQIHLGNRNCSQIDIIFWDEEDKENEDKKLTNWVETVFKLEPKWGDYPNIHFPRMWREFKKEVGRCFCCGEVLEHDGGCYYCFLDRIILEEAIHFPNAWNNWGNHKLHPFRSNFELLFLIFCEPMQTMQQNMNKNNCKVKTGKNTWIWQNITTPLHYITAQRFLECRHRKTNSVPELFSLCKRKIFLILHNYKRSAGVDELPLPRPLIRTMKILLPAALYIHPVRNPARDFVPPQESWYIPSKTEVFESRTT